MFSKKVLSLSMALLLSCANQALCARMYPNITDFSLLYKQEYIIAMMTPERTVIFDCKNQETLITIPTDNNVKMTAVAGLNFDSVGDPALVIGYGNGDVTQFFIDIKEREFESEFTYFRRPGPVNGIAAGTDFNEQRSSYWSVIAGPYFSFFKWKGYFRGLIGGETKEKAITAHNNRGILNTYIGTDEDGESMICQAYSEDIGISMHFFRTEHKGIAYYPKNTDIVATGEFALNKDQKPLIKFINLAPRDEEKKSKFVKLTEEEAHMALEKGLFVHDDGEGNYSMVKKSDNEEEEKGRLVYQFHALSANVGVTEVTFDRKTNMLAVGGRNGTVEFWQVDPIKEESRLLRTYQDHKAAIKKIVFHPKNNLWFSLDDDKILNIYGLNEIIDEEDIDEEDIDEEDIKE